MRLTTFLYLFAGCALGRAVQEGTALIEEKIGKAWIGHLIRGVLGGALAATAIVGEGRIPAPLEVICGVAGAKMLGDMVVDVAIDLLSGRLGGGTPTAGLAAPAPVLVPAPKVEKVEEKPAMVQTVRRYW